MQRRSARYKKCRNDADERQNVVQNESMFSTGNAYPAPQSESVKNNSEPSLRRRRQHEKHHDRPVHRQQAEISLRLNLATSGKTALGHSRWIRISSDKNIPTTPP